MSEKRRGRKSVQSEDERDAIDILLDRGRVNRALIDEIDPDRIESLHALQQALTAELAAWKVRNG